MYNSARNLPNVLALVTNFVAQVRAERDRFAHQTEVTFSVPTKWFMTVTNAIMNKMTNIIHFVAVRPAESDYDVAYHANN